VDDDDNYDNNDIIQKVRELEYTRWISMGRYNCRNYRDNTITIMVKIIIYANFDNIREWQLKAKQDAHFRSFLNPNIIDKRNTILQ
jgi:hypothetical protein